MLCRQCCGAIAARTLRSNRPDGRRADADREAGGTAAARRRQSPTPLVVPDLVGKSIVAARDEVGVVRERHMEATPPVNGVEPQVLLLEITRPADGKPAGEVLSQTRQQQPLAQRRRSKWSLRSDGEVGRRAALLTI